MASNTNCKTSTKCGICSELYHDPHMLPCLHSFCKKCLDKTLEESTSKTSLTCPTCKESSALPASGVQSLPKDHRKTYEAEIAEYDGLIKGSSSVPCDHCVKSGEATSFCCDCCEFLCEKCSDHHQSWRKTQSHELVSCSKEKGRKAIIKNISHKPLTCSVHSKETLDYYCNTCSELLCIRCVVGKHKEHAYQELESVRETEKSDLLSWLNKMKDPKMKLKNSISQIEKVLQRVQANHKEVDRNIEEVFSELQQKIKARKDALLAKSADVALNKETALTLQCEQLKKMENSLSEISSKLESVTQDYTAVEMLSAKQQFTSRAKTLVDSFQKCPLEPCKLDIMPVLLDSKPLENMVDSFGDVSGGCMPIRSTIDLVKMSAVVGKERKMHLRAKDVDGKPVPYGGEPVNVSLVDSNNKTVTGTVVDNGNGVYDISFTPSVAGECELSVAISNEQIQDSPFDIYVRQPKDYKLSTYSRTFSVSSSPGDVAVDINNDVYIAVSGYHCISVFDENGTSIRTIGTAGSSSSAYGQFNSPWGIAIAGDFLYIADQGNHRIQKFTKDGRFISKFGSSGSGNGQLNSPRGIVVDKNGRVFVSEHSNKRVSVFRPNGTFSHHIKGNSADNNELGSPWGLAFDNDGNLNVADYGFHSIRVFTPEGKYISQYASERYPSGITIDDEGFTIIGEHYNSNNSYYYSRIYILNSQHQQIHTIQNFRYVGGVCLDRDGHIFVCDYQSNRVMKY